MATKNLKNTKKASFKKETTKKRLIFEEQDENKSSEEEFQLVDEEEYSDSISDDSHEDQTESKDQSDTKKSSTTFEKIMDTKRIKKGIDYGETDEEDANSQEKTTPILDIVSVRDRMQSTVRILNDFAKLRVEDPESIKHPRSYYMSRLQQDAAAYYSYSAYMIEKLSNLFPPTELLEFLEANEQARPITIRANTLKTRRRELAQALVNRGANVEPIGKWTSVGLAVFECPVPIGATPEYMAGHYMLQSASSFLPVQALGARPNERILDMAAAPGGKTTYIAAEMQNTGCLFANDPSKERCRALIANIHRMGVKNSVICSLDARQFPKAIKGFDRVLLDSPCSGTGIISKDPTVKSSKTDTDFQVLTHLQKELLLAAIDSTEHNPRHAPNKSPQEDSADSDGPGVVVYSTCSITVEENEEIIDYVLRKRPNVRLVDTGLPIGREGFTSFRGKKMHPSLKLTRRFYPHVDNMDGFFVAKLVKFLPTFTKNDSTLSS